MKLLAIILIAGGAGFVAGWLLCAIMAAGEEADRCTACHINRTLDDRHQAEEEPCTRQ